MLFKFKRNIFIFRKSILKRYNLENKMALINSVEEDLRERHLKVFIASKTESMQVAASLEQDMSSSDSSMNSSDISSTSRRSFSGASSSSSFSSPSSFSISNLSTSSSQSLNSTSMCSPYSNQVTYWFCYSLNQNCYIFLSKEFRYYLLITKTHQHRIQES